MLCREGVLLFDNVTRCNGSSDHRFVLFWVALSLSLVFLGPALMFVLFIQPVQSVVPQELHFIPRFRGIVVCAKVLPEPASAPKTVFCVFITSLFNHFMTAINTITCYISYTVVFP